MLSLIHKVGPKEGLSSSKDQEEYTWKSASKNKPGFFEWLVIPFKLCNFHETFMPLMNDLLRSFMEEIVIVYLDHVPLYKRHGTCILFTWKRCLGF